MPYGLIVEIPRQHIPVSKAIFLYNKIEEHSMSTEPRAASFEQRFKARWNSPLAPMQVYHATTYARITQAEYFLNQLISEVKYSKSDGPEDSFVKRDMHMFGCVNAARSALDSLAHELVTYYEGGPNLTKHPKRPVCQKPQKRQSTQRNIQFFKLLDPKTITYNIPLPADLATHIKAFSDSTFCRYFNQLRNAMHHRNFAILQFRTYVAMSVEIAGPDGESRSLTNGLDLQENAGLRTTNPTSELPDPDLSLPDDPKEEPGDKNTQYSKPLLSTFRGIYTVTKEFILETYKLA